jgi:hypothetical protein
MSFHRLFFLAVTPLFYTGCTHALDSGSAAEVSKPSPDGRFGSRCYSWAKDGNKELCSLPFGRLVARPEEYNGRLVSVTGYLIEVFGNPVLFANEQSYLADVDIEGIELMEASAIPLEIRERLATGVFPVVVVGTFDAEYVGISEMRLGALTNIENVAHTVRLPGSGD